MKGFTLKPSTCITPSSSGYIPVPLSNVGVAVRDGVACSMNVDPMLEVGVAVGKGVSCFVAVRVGAGITSVVWGTVYR